MLQIQRHIYMGDMAGRPLGYGLAYFGEADKDPKTYPIPTFFDKKGLIVAPEKIVVKSGFLYHNGNVVQVYAGRPNVSLLVEDKRGRQLGYFPQVAVPVIDGNGTDGNGGGGSGGGSGSGNGSGHGLGSGGGSGGGHGGVIVGSSDLPSVEQILDLLAEQISNDQLHKDLATSIAKIEPLNVDIDAIKAKIPDITQDIENAKAELAEAVARINAQRERITTANVNIEALDSAVKSLNLQLPIFSSRMTSAQNQLSQAVERINADKELINNNIRDIGTLTQKSETAKQEIAVLRTQKGELASSIEQVNTALSNAQETIAQQITNLQSQLDGNVAKIDGVQQAITNYQASIATQIEQVQSKFQIGIAATQANLDRYKQTQATEKEALTNLISTLDGAYKRADGVLTARIAQEEIARANADNANAQKIATLESKTKDTDSKIAILEQTQTTQQSALAESTRQINAKTDGVQANLEAFQQAQVSKNEATAQSINSLQSRADNLSGQVNDIISSQASQHETLVQRIDSVSAEYTRADGNLSTRIANEERARADGDNANASKVSALESKTNETNSKLSQLESTQSSQYQSIATRIDGLQAAYKKADTDLTAKVTAEVTARTQADEVLSTRIAALDTAYKQSDADITARLAREETARATGDNANAQLINELDVAYKAANSTLTANLVSEQTARTSADTALGRRIDDVSAESKQADNIIKASVQEEITARTNADAAIAQTVNALKSDYSSNKSSVASQIKTLSDKDKSTASQISQITANVTTAQQTANTANTKADDGIRRANNAQNKADTADAKATQAKADIVAEQRARADSESSIARQMSALDSKFTNADNAIKASVAQAQQTAANAQQALATAQSQLNAKIDGISVGGRNLLRHTQRLDQLWRFASGGSGNSMTVSNDGMARLTGIGATWKHLGYDISRDVGLNWLKEGQTFTLSVFARKVSGSSHFLSIALRKGVTGGFKDDLVGKNFAVGGEWQRLVVTGTITPGDLQYLFVRFEFWDDGVYELKKPQLEYGNVATDWKPAVEDDNVWRILRTPTDLNALIETGKYYLATNTTNNPVIGWTYLVVEKVSGSRVTQTVWSDGDNKIQYRRVKFDGNWSAWEKTATGSDIAQTNAAIQELKQAQATKEQATAQRIAALDAAYRLADTTLTARLAHEEQTRASANAALTQILDSLQSTVNGNKASIDAQLRTLSDKEKAQATKLSQLESSLGQKADAAALNSLTTKVSQVEGRITAEASKYSTLQTTVGQHTASIQQHSQSIDGLKAQWTVKVESGGIVSGIGLASNNGNSVFAIRANKFYVADPTGTAKRPLFSVLTAPQTINGVSVPKGVYLDSAYIANGSINMLHIADSIQSDNYVVGRSGWRLFKNGTIEINSTFGDGTKIQLTSRGLVGFYANGVKAFELGVFE